MSVEAVEAPRSRGRYLVPLAVILALVGVFFYSLFSGDPSRLPSALIGKPSPQFDLPPIEGFAKDGKTPGGFSSADLTTGEVSIVNVWASWCGPCILEHPVLVKLKQQHDLRLFGINYKDPPAKAKQFLARLGDPYDMIGADNTGRVAIDWGVYGVPETFVVDGEGQIIYRYAGPLSDQIIADELLPAVARARENGKTAKAKPL
jgi:cytochrome c biogenesis protein CcmG/thiol:disulfide interchange protein DsbE